MTDFKIDKDKYPLDVVFISDEKGGYLVEGNDTTKKYRPVSHEVTLISSPLYLEIMSSISYWFNAGQYSGSIFYSKAKMWNSFDSISFFGTKRNINNIDIKIYPTDKGMQLGFEGNLLENNEYDTDTTEEYLLISMAIKHKEFERILDFFEHNNIEQIDCSINKKQLNGLYRLESWSPGNEYKVLVDKRIVKNHLELPDYFADFTNFDTYYCSNDSFRLRVKKKFELIKEKLSDMETEFKEEKETYDQLYTTRQILG